MRMDRIIGVVRNQFHPKKDCMRINKYCFLVSFLHLHHPQ